MPSSKSERLDAELFALVESRTLGAESIEVNRLSL